jgi:hypothetical protein
MPGRQTRGGTPLTDEGLKELVHFTRLQSLSLGVTKVTGAGLKQPSAASGDPAVSAHTDQPALQSKGKNPGPRQERLPQQSPMDWTKE